MSIFDRTLFLLPVWSGDCLQRVGNIRLTPEAEEAKIQAAVAEDSKRAKKRGSPMAFSQRWGKGRYVTGKSQS